VSYSVRLGGIVLITRAAKPWQRRKAASAVARKGAMAGQSRVCGPRKAGQEGVRLYAAAGFKFILLFINEELFGQVKETHVKVPRTSGEVDEYYVKAVYKHGDSLIESDASDIQTDAITAKEVQQEILARETYNRIVSSLNHFEKVYSTQIASLKRSGNKSIRGLLSLPVKNRAEVIFLLELDRLKKENEGDEDLVKEGLEILYESVDNGEGPWAVTPASKRRKIKRHIEKYIE